ncbi:hypothetical protein D9M70_588690 [compost metagenome]
MDHADRGIGLAGGDRFQQLVGGAAVVDQIDLQAVFFEEAFFLRHHDGRQAESILVPGKGQLARCRPCLAAQDQRGCGDGGGAGQAQHAAAARVSVVVVVPLAHGDNSPILVVGGQAARRSAWCAASCCATSSRTRGISARP